MTKLLEQAVSQARELPDEVQDDVADTLFAHLAEHDRQYRLTAEQIEDVKRIQEGLRSGKIRLAADEEAAEVWKKCGL